MFNIDEQKLFVLSQIIYNRKFYDPHLAYFVNQTIENICTYLEHMLMTVAYYITSFSITFADHWIHNKTLLKLLNI